MVHRISPLTCVQSNLVYKYYYCICLTSLCALCTSQAEVKCGRMLVLVVLFSQVYAGKSHDFLFELL